MFIKKGLVNVNGGTDGYCFYELNGKRVVRRIGKVGKSRYKRSPSFEKMRQNMSEFGAASVIGKAVRLGLVPFSKSFADSNVSGRLNAVVKKVISNGSGEKGQRRFEFGKNGHLLNGFEMNSEYPFDYCFHAPINLSFEDGKMFVEVPPFSPSVSVRLAKGASHFRLVFAAAALCDYGFDPKSKRYEPEVERMYEVRGHVFSDPLPIDLPVSDAIRLQVDLPALRSKKAPGISGVVVGSGIEFLQAAEGEFLPLREKRGMRLGSLIMGS